MAFRQQSRKKPHQLSLRSAATAKSFPKTRMFVGSAPVSCGYGVVAEARLLDEGGFRTACAVRPHAKEGLCPFSHNRGLD